MMAMKVINDANENRKRKQPHLQEYEDIKRCKYGDYGLYSNGHVEATNNRKVLHTTQDKQSITCIDHQNININANENIPVAANKSQYAIPLQSFYGHKHILPVVSSTKNCSKVDENHSFCQQTDAKMQNGATFEKEENLTESIINEVVDCPSKELSDSLCEDEDFDSNIYLGKGFDCSFSDESESPCVTDASVVPILSSDVVHSLDSVVCKVLNDVTSPLLDVNSVNSPASVDSKKREETKGTPSGNIQESMTKTSNYPIANELISSSEIQSCHSEKLSDSIELDDENRCKLGITDSKQTCIIANDDLISSSGTNLSIEASEEDNAAKRVVPQLVGTSSNNFIAISSVQSSGNSSCNDSNELVLSPDENASDNSRDILYSTEDSTISSSDLIVEGDNDSEELDVPRKSLLPKREYSPKPRRLKDSKTQVKSTSLLNYFNPIKQHTLSNSNSSSQLGNDKRKTDNESGKMSNRNSAKAIPSLDDLLTPSPSSSEKSPCLGQQKSRRSMRIKSPKGLENSKRLEQLYIDVGQHDFGHVSCPTCGMVYTKGQEEDEIAHAKYHQRLLQKLKFKGWKTERLLQLYDDGKIVLINPDDKLHVKKVSEVREVVDWELGFTVTVNGFSSKDEKAFLFISKQRVVGCVFAVAIKKAYPIIMNQDVPSPEKKQGIPTLSWCCSTKPVPALCGISRIWVIKHLRRRKIAHRLIECVRNNFIFGCVIGKNKLAFSDPTPDGRAFAEKYIGSPNILVFR